MKLFQEFKYSPMISGDLLQIHSVFNKIKRHITTSTKMLDDSDNSERSETELMEVISGLFPVLMNSKDLIERFMNNSLQATFEGLDHPDLMNEPAVKLLTVANIVSDFLENDEIISQSMKRVDGYVDYYGTHSDKSDKDKLAHLYIAAINKEVPIIYEDILFPALETAFPRKSAKIFKIIVSLINSKK